MRWVVIGLVGVLLSVGPAFAQATAPENFGVRAVLQCQPLMGTPVATGAGTGEQTLFTCILPATATQQVLDVTGRHLRITAMFSKAANGNGVTARLYFGAEVISSGSVTTTSAGTVLTLSVNKTGAATQSVWGSGYSGTALITPYSAAGSEDDTAAITVKATCQDGSNSAGDCTLQDMFVESFD